MPIVPTGTFIPPVPLQFEWDEQETLRYFYYIPAQLHDRLLALTHNACFALTLGCANWILERLEPFGFEIEVCNYVDAAWAEMTVEWYCERVTRARDEWRGPVKGPIASAMSVLYDAMDGKDHNPVQADRTVWMHNLARHVIEPLQPFDLWFESTLVRLEENHSSKVEGEPETDIFADEFFPGKSVSPEALDPGFPYHPGEANRQLTQFVERLRRNGNPFVIDDQERAL